MKQIAPRILQIAALAICFILQACDCGHFYKCEEVPVTEFTTLPGKWQCMRITGGFAGIDSNVSNANWYLTFSPGNIYHEERSGQLFAQGTYTLDQLNDTLYNIHFAGRSTENVLYIKGSDTLYIDERMADGYEYTYKRR